MKYLFFDIECSNCFGGIGKMCEFGYVLTDEEFNVIMFDDIPMCPGKGRENDFHLIGRKHERDLELAYSYDHYREQPEFPFFYESIRRLMEDGDTICFAYSMDNDIPHLYNACKRYKLKPIEYTCYDVQKLVAAYLEEKGQMSLHNACKRIAGPACMVRLQEHLSRDDAMMEKLIFEAICLLTKKKPVELLEESKYASTDSSAFMKRIDQRKLAKKKHDEYVAQYKALVAPIEDWDKPENKGKRFNVSDAVKCDPKLMKAVIELVTSKGGIFVNSISSSDYFIAHDEDNREAIKRSFRHPYNGMMLVYDDLFALKLKKRAKQRINNAVILKDYVNRY